MPKPPSAYRCSREGCSRRRATNHNTGQLFPHCSLVCASIRKELADLERLVREAGTAEAADDWAFAVEVADLVTELQARKRRLIYASRQDRHNA
jgi:hypothetical protein